MFATLTWINPAKTGALLALPGLIVAEYDLRIDLFVRYKQVTSHLITNEKFYIWLKVTTSSGIAKLTQMLPLSLVDI